VSCLRCEVSLQSSWLRATRVVVRTVHPLVQLRVVSNSAAALHGGLLSFSLAVQHARGRQPSSASLQLLHGVGGRLLQAPPSPSRSNKRIKRRRQTQLCWAHACRMRL